MALSRSLMRPTKWHTWMGLVCVSLVGCQPDQQTPAGSADVASTETQSQGLGAEKSATGGPSSGESETAQRALSGLPSEPSQTASASSSENSQTPARERAEIMNRPFATLQPRETNDPQELVEHLREIDAAIQDLVVAGSTQLLNEQLFTEFGMRLGRMKLGAGQRLADSEQASDEQRKTGLISQLVALSHMSGLRDVESAKQLERLAAELAQSDDPELSHQSRVVLLGFEIQALQNGVRSDPSKLIAEAERLIARAEDRNFPEFMVLQQAMRVLQQMGYPAESQQVQDIIVTEYRDAADAQLRGEAWLIEVEDSQAYQNFLTAFQSLGGESFDPTTALAAIRGLYEAFPSINTLEQIASTVPNIEYSGHVEFSQQIVEYIQRGLEGYDEDRSTAIEEILSGHRARLAILGEPFQLEGIVGFDGEPVDWSDYENKVVLVDFWATWCLPCLREIPTIRETHAAFADEGFAVMGINMDENLESATQFVEKQTFPWRSFHADDPNQLGFKASFAQELGIRAIPFMVLVGRDGTVKSIHVRGEKLQPTVERLLSE